jgi:hypothetical protein
MRSRLAISVIVVGLLVTTANAQNQIPNWEFDEPMNLTDIWLLWQGEHFNGLSIVEGAGLSGRYAMKIDIGDGPLDPLQIFRAYLKLEQGVTYTISFMAKADAPRTVTVQLQARSLHSWQVYWQEANLQLTTEPQTFTFEYTHTGATVGGTGVFNSDIDLHFLLVGNRTDLYLDRIWMGAGAPPPIDPEELARAVDPVPAAGAEDVPRETSLSWVAGPFAVAHDVYLGADLADVKDASRADSRGVLVGQGQTTTTFAPAELLEFGTTYYWRVDEVNAPPDSTVFKGHVWSFTVEPYSYTLTGVRATASSAEPGMGPEKTVDGSGLTAGRHSTTDTAMWFTAQNQVLPAWIQYEFLQMQKILEMEVWNQNQTMETFLGFGAKDVLIEYSLDGQDWTEWGRVVIPKADSTPTYEGSVIDLGGIEAKFVRLTIESNWGGLFQRTGLSEVRFQYLPMLAREPKPAVGSEQVSLNPVLTWRPGREAVSHQVYISGDRQAVADGTAPSSNVTTTSYQVSGLEYGKMYHWKVNEVGPDGTREGPVWSFSTTEFFVVDDMESYDADKNHIYDTWVDGYFDGRSNSVVGYMEAEGGTFGERGIVRSGRQSMPMEYDNSRTPFFSEARRAFASVQNWAGNGADSVSLWFRGRPAKSAEVDVGNDPAKLYVTVADSAGRSATVYHPDAGATTVTTWTQWVIPQKSFGNVDFTRVNAITIGVGDKAAPAAGGAGRIYIDDVGFGRRGSSDPGTSGLTAWYTLEGDVTDASGNGRDGTAFGNPVYIDGPAGLGQALLFNGAGGQYVHVGNWNPSADTGQLSVSVWAKWNGLTTFWQGLVAKRDTWAEGQTMWQIEANQTTGVVSFARHNITGATTPALPIGEWTHVVLTFNGTAAQFYTNGNRTGTSSTSGFSFGSKTDAAMVFGACQGDGGNPFNGALDDIRIYNRPLAGFEVSYLSGK